VHGIHQAKAFFHSALSDEFLDGVSDIYKAAAIGDLEP
jgi:hypothetical protein